MWQKKISAKHERTRGQRATKINMYPIDYYEHVY